jgi:hypothetical protein
MWCGLRDPAFKTSNPVAFNFLITLRTVWSSQPEVRAIRLALSLQALDSTIWLRRSSNRFFERKPVLAFPALFRSILEHKSALSYTCYITILFSLLRSH